MHSTFLDVQLTTMSLDYVIVHLFELWQWVFVVWVVCGHFQWLEGKKIGGVLKNITAS